jgi:hypothetical protein
MKNKMRLIVGVLVGAAAALCTLPGTARGQIYVAGGSAIAKYDATTGLLLNASFITSGVNSAHGIAVSGGYLFVAMGTGKVGKYNADTGGVVNNAFASTTYSAKDVALLGGDLFVTTGGNDFQKWDATTPAGVLIFQKSTPIPAGMVLSGGSVFLTSGSAVRQYSATTGTVINSSFITGLSQASGIAANNGFLYVVNSGNNTIGKYDAITGTAVNAWFITGGALWDPQELAIADGKLYVWNHGNATMGLYDPATGAAINESFMTGLSGNGFTVVSAVPEPSTYAALAGLAALVFTAWRRRCQGRKSSTNATAGESPIPPLIPCP